MARARDARVLLVSALVVVQGAPAVDAAGRRAEGGVSRIETLGRILELEDRRSTGDGELATLLRDRDPGIRRRAALAAGRVADPALAGPLIDLMNDQQVEVRRMAAFALGLLGERGATDRLLAALSDSDARVRGRAAEALGRIGDARAAGEIARLVVGALPRTIGRMTVRGDDPGDPTDSWAELRLALVALARLKDVPAGEVALLSEGKPRFDWWVATWVAMRLESPALRPVLAAAATSDDPRSRALAARGLGALKDASAVPTLSMLARDADAGVAAAALRALRVIGDVRGTAVAAFALGSPSDLVRREALLSLAALPPDATLRSRLAALAGDRDPWIRSAAFGALAHTDPEDFALVLSGMDPDPVWWVRAALAEALGAVGDGMSVGILHAMLQDEDARVIPAVLAALVKARGRDALDTLVRRLEHPDLGVRVAAAEGITRLGAQGLTAPLVAAWQRGLADGDGEIEARLAAVSALAAQPEAAATEALATVARQDPCRAVRWRAATALRERGGEAIAPGPEAVARPPLDYRIAMAPYNPQPDVALYTPRVFLHTRRGIVEIHLDVVESPLTTASFVALARRGFYDGLVFHRVEPGFVVQGGCPRGDGNGGPGYVLRSEVTRRPFGRGSVGIATSGKDTGGSQFFITLSAQPHLDGEYTRFGTVVSGMDVVDSMRPGDVIEHVDVWAGE